MQFHPTRRWRVILLVAAASCLSLATMVCADPPPTDFPSKPIKIIVYTAPGGAIDRTAREFKQIAERHVDATFTVENLAGAGGLVAISELLDRRADGYTLLACTKSNIAKLVATGGDTGPQPCHAPQITGLRLKRLVAYRMNQKGPIFPDAKPRH